MPDTETETVEEKVEELEEKIDDLEEQAAGKNQLEMEAYDLSIKASSEDMGMSELIDEVSTEMENLTERALIGEYQELENRSLHNQIFGDD